MKTLYRSLAALVVLATGTPAFAAPADSEDLQALREQVRALEQQLKVLSRKLELREEAAAAAPPAAKVTVNDKGFTLASPDGNNALKIRGLVQLDSRLFFGEPTGVANDSFVLRRARLIAEGTFAKNYTFQLVPEFGGSSVSILDANFGVALGKGFQVKFGKFKYPVGLELLQSDSWTFFNERSIVTNLVPNRDLGIQASGELVDGRVNYAVGVFGGAPDNGSTSNSDVDREKDLAGRVMVSPFKNAADSPLQGLSVGVAGSVGRAKSAAGRTSGYRTDGQQTFFAYNAAVIADGLSWRLAPQFDYRNGSFGAVGEYVVSTVNLRPSATGAKSEIQNRAWQLGAGYVLTGEDSSYGGVVPASNFDFAAGTWGAFEVTARYASLRVDSAAFPAFASPNASADQASSVGVGFNWYLSKAVAFKFDYYQTELGLNAGASAGSLSPLLRHDEQVFISRFQLSF